MSDPSVLQRPQPSPRRSDWLRGRFELAVEWWRSQRKSRTGSWDDPATALADLGAGPQLAVRSQLFFVALIVGGAVLLAVGAAWSWQTWAQRSAEPIDNLLPVLVADGPNNKVGDEVVAPAEPIASAPVPATEAAVAEPTAVPQIIVHVSGAVARPGVVEILAGSRVYQAVAGAGGAGADADLERVNLAAPLVDGERIHVPSTGEDEVPVLVPSQRPATVVTPSGPIDSSSSALVDINLASESELQQLPGVGPSLAQAIVQMRTDRGPFFTVEELLDVPGIGDAKLAAIAPQVVVVSPAFVGE